MHHELYQQLKQSDPTINEQWVPEIKRLVSICQSQYQGNWDLMYREYTRADKQHAPETKRQMQRDVGFIRSIQHALGHLDMNPIQIKKVSDVNLEDAVRGVRIGPVEAGGSKEYSLLLEVMRDANEHNMTLETYETELFTHPPQRGMERDAWRIKVALVTHAQKIAKTLGGKLAYNEQNEGVYVMFDAYTSHGNAD